MQKKIIIIGGYLASGKSTFALQLSKAIHIPYLIKDTYKNAICENVLINNRQDSSLYSAVTFDAMMYVIERLFEADYPIIIEGNFVPDGVKKLDEAGVIRGLINKYHYKSLTYKFTGDTKVLYQRFMEREKSPERGWANKMFTELFYEDFDRSCRDLEGFDVGGEIINIDTTDFDKTDFEQLIKRAYLFMDS